MPVHTIPYHTIPYRTTLNPINVIPVTYYWSIEKSDNPKEIIWATMRRICLFLVSLSGKILKQWSVSVIFQINVLNAKLLRSICSAKDTQSIYCSRTNSFQLPNNCPLHHINHYRNKKKLTVQCEIFLNCTKSWIRLFMVSLYRRRRWWKAKQRLQSSWI